jgi:hypothetical protein
MWSKVTVVRRCSVLASVALDAAILHKKAHPKPRGLAPDGVQSLSHHTHHVIRVWGKRRRCTGSALNGWVCGWVVRGWGIRKVSPAAHEGVRGMSSVLSSRWVMERKSESVAAARLLVCILGFGRLWASYGRWSPQVTTLSSPSLSQAGAARWQVGRPLRVRRRAISNQTLMVS